jgi:hypothetical protein
VTLADGRDLVLHIEFQDCRSHPPMPWWMLALRTPHSALRTSSPYVPASRDLSLATVECGVLCWVWCRC